MTPGQPREASFGSVSSGTMRVCDLVPAFADTLDYLNNGSNPDHAALVREAEGLETDDDGYYTDEDRADNILEALTEALEEYAPSYGYFGAHEGDGADYGFWLSDAIEEVPKFNDSADIPDSVGEAIVVNDHGNMTLLARDSSGELQVVWAVV